MTLEGNHGLWGDLLRPDAGPEDTDFSVIGIPFDGLACARKGAALAPERLRYWSRHLTPFSEDRTRLHSISVCDLGDIHIAQPEQDFEKIQQRIAHLPNIPIILGGDHSVTIPIFAGQRQRFASKRLGVLWVDAHPDLCDFFDGSRLSHACVLRRGLDYGIKQDDVCLVGLRSWEDQEIDLIENGQMHVFSMPEIETQGIQAVAARVRGLFQPCDAVHISLDIDCLDPSSAPGTGIPDAGGMTMRQLLTLLKTLEGLPLVGLDVVEIAPPIDPSEASVFAGLKVIMEFFAVIARQRQAVRD